MSAKKKLYHNSRPRRGLQSRILCLLSALLILVLTPLQALADELPYDSYNYTYWNDIVYTPAPYVPNGSVTGDSLGIGNFSEPQDLYVADDGQIYVADTGNNRVVILNSDMDEVVRVIETFERDGEEDTFNAPYGVFVSENGELYVADSNNKRIVVLTTEGEFVKIVDNPQSNILEDGFDFTPLKVAVDYADRIYVIAKNAFEGILVFDSEGSFIGYFGTIEVKITLWEKFWRRLASKEERANQQLYIPTEFTGIDVDEDGFVYASNIDSDGEQGVRRLNPSGEDVIQKGENGNVGGDLTTGTYGTYAGVSEFTDVTYRGKGIYSVLDRKRGRIFTYDREGNLLYIFGGLGTQEGTFNTPIAIDEIGDNLIVLDAYYGSIMIFSATEYGSLINEATGLRYDGDETQAVALWERVLELDENNELANTGIGKAYLTAGENQLAMKYLKLGMNQKYYSIAWKRYRNEILTENIGPILTGLAVLIVIWIVLRQVLKKRKKPKSQEGGLA
ncbi:MAG: gluconolactonase [Lachnospiraceae bacterium]|nr:gluconolactonase [Lachnospiraceae bacterium]MCD8396929.1 gluconolactonase [Lachnospiraceae bacterium]